VDWSFGDLLWYSIIIFFFVTFLMVLFYIFGDIFRDHDLNGLGKTLWILFIIILPLLGSLIYLIARGQGMSERSVKAAKEMQDAQNAYIRDVAGSSAADQIHKAKELLDSGAISQAEYDAIKAKALA
jgi:ABC-type multidrug transport system fused ATPase/permease subunit